MLRIIRAPFYQLCKTLKERHLLEDSIRTFVKVQVEMVLLVGGHNHRFGVIQKNSNNPRRQYPDISRKS
jgi:hypothetical protein